MKRAVDLLTAFRDKRGYALGACARGELVAILGRMPRSRSEAARWSLVLRRWRKAIAEDEAQSVHGEGEERMAIEVRCCDCGKSSNHHTIFGCRDGLYRCADHYDASEKASPGEALVSARAIAAGISDAIAKRGGES